VRFRLGLLSALVAALLLPPAALGAVAFAPPQYVDKELAGGEPMLFSDAFHHTLLYTSHEGTTHLYQPGITTSPMGDFLFVSNYRNQVIIWVSKDDGATWKRIDWNGTGFRTNPLENTGFSDPDFTQDAGGRVYDTGIDLANDALFSSNDGGFNWDRGTPQCNDGDRPWLAGGVKDEVFMVTDTAEDGESDPTGTGHALFQSTDGGQTCHRVGPDYGNTDKGGATAYVGEGKPMIDHARQRLVEGEFYTNKDGKVVGIGAGTWKRGDSQFTPHFIAQTTVQAHWPSIAQDASGNLYMVWDTDNRAGADTTGGCGGDPTPLANAIEMAVSKDFGQTWSLPVTITAPQTARVLWPWAFAGDDGKVSVVWYQSDKVTDPDCAPGDVKWSIYEAHIGGAGSPGSMHETVVNASGGPIHEGGICQGGTTCVATGQDRRLGDYFTNTVDARGCVVIASGDTRLTDSSGNQLPTSRPIFIRQIAGPTLVGHGTCGPNDKGDGTYDESYVKGERHAHHPRCAARTHRHRRHAKQRAHRASRRHAHHRSSCARPMRHVKHHRRR
jgi:hypothetical protein